MTTLPTSGPRLAAPPEELGEDPPLVLGIVTATDLVRLLAGRDARRTS